MQIATPRGASSLILGLLVAIAANALWPTLSDAVGLDGDALRYGLAGGAGLLSMLGFMSLGRGGPQPGEYWMALVPFAERPGAKDRPCLVIKRGSRSCSVLYITSQDKMGSCSHVMVQILHDVRKRVTIRVTSSSSTITVLEQTDKVLVATQIGHQPELNLIKVT